MQAVILAAGKGARLQPYTDSMPKCMIPVKGKPLLFHALDCLSEAGKIEEVIIVCGYKGEVIREQAGASWKGMKLTYLVNGAYEKTNNVYSLYLVKDHIHEDCLLLECDLFYRQDVIDAVMEGEADCNILVSPYDKQTMDGTVVMTDGDKVRELIIKAHQDPGRDYSRAYKTVNLYQFREAFFNKKLMPALELYIKTGNLQSYYELVLGSLIYYRNDDIRIKIVEASRWYEIDDGADYERAEQSLL